MRCIDFTNKNILTLSALQRTHLATCPTCRLSWEEQAIRRATINQPHDSAAEPYVATDDKPLSEVWLLSPEIQRMGLECKQHQAPKLSEQLKTVKSLLASLFPENNSLCETFSTIAVQFISQFPMSSNEFAKCFSRVLKDFPAEVAGQMSEQELATQITKRLKENLRTHVPDLPSAMTKTGFR